MLSIASTQHADSMPTLSSIQSKLKGCRGPMFADDFWKRKSYSTAAMSLEDHPEAIESAKQALKLKGVGKGCAALVRCIRIRLRVRASSGGRNRVEDRTRSRHNPLRSTRQRAIVSKL